MKQPTLIVLLFMVTSLTLNGSATYNENLKNLDLGKLAQQSVTLKQAIAEREAEEHLVHVQLTGMAS